MTAPLEYYQSLIDQHQNTNGEVDFVNLVKEFKKVSFKNITSLAKSVDLSKVIKTPFGDKTPQMMEMMMQKMNELEKEPVAFQACISDSPICDAFKEKKSAHTSSGGSIIPPPIVPMAYDLLSLCKRVNRSVCYINVPFCQTRCLFCMFYIAPYKKEESKRFADALIKELQLHADRVSQNQKPIQALYFGGGTPTALESEDLFNIITACKKYLPLANDCEITVEGRLSYFDDKKIESTLKAGANRFSLGVQTFDTKVRQALGRLSKGEDLIYGLEHLASFDEAAIVIDLMYGLPNQTQDSFLQDLQIVKELPLHGVDLYQLIMLENSPLTKATTHENPKFANLPSPSERAKLYELGCNFLSSNHWRQLSVSHFSKSTRERNIYNVLAKSDADTLAFGPGAGGKIQGVSFMNTRNYEEYIELVNAGKKPVSMMFAPHRDWKLHKQLGEMLELGFIDLKKINSTHNIDLLCLASPVFKQWQEAGLLSISRDYINLTLAGLFWSVTMSNLLNTYLLQNKIS